MNLRFVWHIFKKDARRLWWMIALTLALLGRLVHFDSLRVYATPGSEEGWLNILLPLAWSFLIALAMLEDPAESDTPFWATVPCKWPSLLAAKAVFVAIVIHVPYLVACAVILQSRGFPPAEYLTVLFSRQLVLLAITTASVGLAAVVRNVTQFMALAILLATAITAPYMGWDRDGANIAHIRHILAFTVAALAACWIAIAQYARRNTFLSRQLGIGVILIVAAIWYLPQQRFYGLQSALYPPPTTAGELSVHLADRLEPPPELRGVTLPLQFGAASVGVPIVMNGLRDHTHVRLEPGPWMLDAAGNRYPADRAGGWRGMDPCCANRIPSWQILSLAPADYERIKNSPVTIYGRYFVDYYRPLDPVIVHYGSTVAVAGVGNCAADMLIRDNPSDESLQVECESPNELPPIEVKLLELEGNRKWSQFMNGAGGTLMSYPAGAWLSPVSRRETNFRLTDEEHYMPLGVQWLVPREIVQNVQISLAPELPEGAALIDYKLPGLKLSQFAIKP